MKVIQKMQLVKCTYISHCILWFLYNLEKQSIDISQHKMKMFCIYIKDFDYLQNIDIIRSDS